MKQLLGEDVCNILKWLRSKELVGGSEFKFIHTNAVLEQCPQTEKGDGLFYFVFSPGRFRNYKISEIRFNQGYKREGVHYGHSSLLTEKIL